MSNDGKPQPFTTEGHREHGGKTWGERMQRLITVCFSGRKSQMIDLLRLRVMLQV